MTTETTIKNWENLIKVIDTYITSPRKDQLIKMYEKFSERIMTAPASSHADRHNCFPGGYLDHILRVCDMSKALYDIWRKVNAGTDTFTFEELIFSALNHDLGKIGTEEGEYYIPNDSQWHKERGQIYKLNGTIDYMKVPDRSLYLLQQHGIPVTQNEYLAIKLHDGLYSKGNEGYFMAHNSDMALKSNLPVLLHHADHLATLVEDHNKGIKPEVVTVATKHSTKKVNDPVVDNNLKNMFDELFK